MIDLILAAALIQAADPCNAAGRAATPLAGCPTWRQITRHPEARGYVDPASVRRDGDRVELMTRTLPNQPVQGRIYSFNTHLELNCAARARRALRFTGFDAEGRTVIAFGADEAASPAPRGSAFASLLTEFCRR
jgi:hypothetical protein